MATFMHLYLICFIFTFYRIGDKVKGNTADEDLTLTFKEKKALDELKSRVQSDLPNNYMKTAVYLINYVRAAGNNVNRAEEMLRETLQWRKEYNMDNILKEDFSDMEQEFPIDLQGVDYDGQPVLVVNLEDWDVRRSHISGLHPRNYRYSMRAVELASQKVRDAQMKGRRITRFRIIFNMKGFSLWNHACIQCLPPYVKFLSALQKYFPGMVDSFYMVNSPTSLETVVRVLAPYAGKSFKKGVKIYGTNKADWEKALFKIIPPDQLDPSLGGTKINN